MQFLLPVLFLASVVATPNVSQPNHKLTPGVVLKVSQSEICKRDYLKNHPRKVSNADKLKVCREYDVGSACPGPNWEIDHLVPRELGGSDSVMNLWPQPIAEAKIKDKLENVLHAAVCSNRISLKEAQMCIAGNWYGCWECWNEDNCSMGKGLK